MQDRYQAKLQRVSHMEQEIKSLRRTIMQLQVGANTRVGFGKWDSAKHGLITLDTMRCRIRKTQYIAVQCRVQSCGVLR